MSERAAAVTPRTSPGPPRAGYAWASPVLHVGEWLLLRSGERLLVSAATRMSNGADRFNRLAFALYVRRRDLEASAKT